jgi:hypothetical protein
MDVADTGARRQLFEHQTAKRLGLLPAGRRGSLTPPDLARLSLVDFSEYSIKSSDAAEAGAKCDFRQRQVRLVNEPLSPLHAHGLGNLNRARSNVLLKQPAQMTGADSKPCGKILHAALINRALMDQPHCPVDRRP